MQLTFYIVLLLYFVANSHSCNICECSAKRELFLCDCTRRHTKRNCNESNNIFFISSAQLFLPSNIYLDKIEDINVHNIPLNIFDIPATKLLSVKRFSLRSCNTTIIDKQSFIGMTSLTFLTLENNTISYIEEDIFKNNNKLEHINLSNNYIKDLPENLFRNLSNLKRINLSFNRIKKIKQTSFLQNKQLQDINLSNNHIEEIDSNVFRDLKNIINVHLQNNNIHILPVEIFDSLSNLRLVNLSNNNLTSIATNAFKMNLNLEKLYLNSNKITSISSNIIVALKKLYYLDLEDNLLDCDCKMKNFISAYKIRDISGHISCSKPDNLAIKHVSSISIEDLVCPPRINNCAEIKSLSKNYIKIACEIFGYPTPTVRWTYTENITCTDCYEISFSSIENEKYWTNLTIFDVSLNSKQMYKINISNNAGSDQYVYNQKLNNTFNLIMAEVIGQAPKIIDCVEKTSNLSNSVIISCSISCNLEPKYIWTFEGHKLTSNIYNMSISQKPNNIYVAELTIYNVSSNSKGIYELYTENQYGGNQHDYNLTVNNTIDPEIIAETSKIKTPVIETKITNSNTHDKHKDVLDIERISYKITENDKSTTNAPEVKNHSIKTSSPKVLNCTRNPFEGTVTIACQISGNPTPRTTWSYGTHKINNNHYYRSTFETVNDYQHWANLTILYVSSETSGLYTLEVMNDFGTFHYSESIMRANIIFPMISSLIVCSILLLIFLMICCKVRRNRNKNRTTNMKHDFENSEKSSYYQEEIFSTNDSRRNFNDISLLVFNNDFNTIQANRTNFNTDNNGSSQNSCLMNNKRGTIVMEEMCYLPDE